MTARDSASCATQGFAQSQGPLPSRLRRGRSRSWKSSIERGLRDDGDEGAMIDASGRGGNSKASYDYDCDRVSRRRVYSSTVALTASGCTRKRCPHKRRGCVHRMRGIVGFYDMWKDLQIHIALPQLRDTCLYVAIPRSRIGYERDGGEACDRIM
ncbi:hypothetical protein BC629DRAFT_1447998, partial [Irpex lacteus]